MSTSSTVLVSEQVPVKPPRLASLDQFRGYAVLGMLLVNYFNGYAVCPQTMRHSNDYCSYADTIMPQFIFAVGFALRLTFGRRAASQGLVAAYARLVRRLLGLILVSLVIYTVRPRAENWELLSRLGVWGAIAEPLKSSWFQTLMHIAVTSLWIVPVLRGSAGARVTWMLGSAVAHVALSYWFNFTWINSPPNAIDGGPLGFLTWSIPAILGTLACDFFVEHRDFLKFASKRLWGALFVSILIMAVGWVISCGTRLYDVPQDQIVALRGEKLASDPVWPNPQRLATQTSRGEDWRQWLAEPPFVRPPDQDHRKWNYWMMSQRAGTLSYAIFAAGFSLAVYWLFFVICDLWGVQFFAFRTFGTNALLAYVLHGLVGDAVQPFFPDDSPAWYALTGLALFFLINWIFVRHLEKQEVYLRV